MSGNVPADRSGFVSLEDALERRLERRIERLERLWRRRAPEPAAGETLQAPSEEIARRKPRPAGGRRVP
jgi:hypothetical protein